MRLNGDAFFKKTMQFDRHLIDTTLHSPLDHALHESSFQTSSLRVAALYPTIGVYSTSMFVSRIA